MIINDTNFRTYLSMANNVDSLTKSEEFALSVIFFKTKDIHAAHRLILSHLKLVIKMSMKYKNYNLSVSELISEGNMGLMYAIKKFNPYLGFRLSTYAMWWIKSFIQEYVLKSWSLIKISNTAVQKKIFFNFSQLKQKLLNYTNDVNVLLTHKTNLSDNIVYGVKHELVDVCLHNSISKLYESHQEILNIASHSTNCENNIIKRQVLNNRIKILVRALKMLDKRELEIFISRKLIEVPVTLNILSIRFNISKERVRQIESRAFNKVRIFVLKGVDINY